MFSNNVNFSENHNIKSIAKGEVSKYIKILNYLNVIRIIID